jgi:purine nucleoside phosphorylase
MRDAAHPVYVKEARCETLLIIDEVGYLNPRFETGGVSLIYDHII